MTTLKKITKSIKDKSLGYKIKKTLACHGIKNKNIRVLQEEQYAYDKLRKKYRNIIKEGVEILPGKKSDKIWICWFQGEENAPPIVKACINSVKKAFCGKEIIVLDGSTMYNYADFPDYIKEKYEKGVITPAHFSDLLRLELLCKYGGMWIDSTVLCTCTSDKISYITESDFFVYKEMDLIRRDKKSIAASSWFIYSASNNPILLLTQRLLYSYWSEHTFLNNYFCFHLFFSMAAERYPEIWNSVPFYNNNSPHTLQFELDNTYNEKRWRQLTEISDFHKLNRGANLNGDSFRSYIIKTYS